MLIARVTAVTDEFLSAFARLAPQLKFDFPTPTQEDLRALVDSRNSILFVARHPDENAPISGMLTLILYRTPTGIRARIEDLVVDEVHTRQGIGEALIRRALATAHEAGADGVALTCNPRRKAANRLYQRIGFKRWETNVYQYKFEK